MSELNNLIPVSYDNLERPTVSGRELHEFFAGRHEVRRLVQADVRRWSFYRAR